MAISSYHITPTNIEDYHRDLVRQQMEQQKRQMMHEMQMMNRDPYGSCRGQEIAVQAPQQPVQKAQDKRLLLLEV